MIATIQHNCSRKFLTAGIFIDLQKAFDSIWHNGMLYRLAELGLGDKFIKLMSSFLKERKIKVRVNNYTSEAKLCQVGLPQGSILSPLLFVIYIRDMLATVDGLALQYADDCSVICWKPNQTELNSTLSTTCDKVSDWLSKWRLKVNCSKTDVIYFKGQPTQLQISKQDIHITKETKVLGLLVDQTLRFKQQKEQARTTLAKKWGMLLPFIYQGLLPKTTRVILLTVIVPKALHNAYIWDPNCEVTLHSCLKDLLGAPFNPSTLTLHKMANVPPPEVKNDADIFSLCRLATKDATLYNILIQTKSSLQKKIKCCIVKLLGRHFEETEIDTKQFKRGKIKKALKEKADSMWQTHLTQGYNGEGLLSYVVSNYLDQSPIPLTLPRKLTGQLCSMLTGQAKLPAYQYKIAQTYSPTCSCKTEDETVHHYLFNCPNFYHLRKRTELDTTTNMISLISYIVESERFI